MKRNATHSRGQVLVEFALVVPIFLVLLFGMIEFGRAWMTKNILTGAAREAVRRLAVIPYDNSVTGEAYLRAVSILSSAGLDTGRWDISLTATDNNGVQVPAIDPNAKTMKADVTYNFPVFIV